MLSSPPTMTTKQVSLCALQGFVDLELKHSPSTTLLVIPTKAHLPKKKSTRSNTKARGTADAGDAEFRTNKSDSRNRSAKGSKRPTSTFDFSKILNLPPDVLLLIFEQLEPPKRTYSIVASFRLSRENLG